jgi:hypothetical protein
LWLLAVGAEVGTVLAAALAVFDLQAGIAYRPARQLL